MFDRTPTSRAPWSEERLHAAYAGTTDRELYHLVVNYEEHRCVFPFLRARLDALLAPTAHTGEHGHPARRPDVVAALAGVLAERRADALALGQRAAGLGVAVLPQVVRAYAPVGLIDGCALQFVSTLAKAHHVPNLRLHELFVGEMGGRAGHAAYPASHGADASHAALYRTMLRDLQCYLPDVHTTRFSQDASIPDEAFALALIPLGLSMFPDSLLPEIAGVALYYYLLGGSFALSALAPSERAFMAAHQIPAELSAPALRAVDAVVALLDGDDGTLAPRLWGVFHAMGAAEDRWVEATLRPLESRPATARERMLAMMARKAPHAHGHHGRRKLNGLRIDDGLAPSADLDVLLDALAASPYVKPGQPAQSRLLTRSIGLEGPMCGVFAPDEIEVIAAWIHSLPSAPPRPEIGGAGVRVPTLPTEAQEHARDAARRDARAQFEADALQRYEHMPERELFHCLVWSEAFPDAVAYARHYAKQRFVDAAQGMDEGHVHDPVPAFFPYSPGALGAWQRRQVQVQVETIAPRGKVTTMTREEYRWQMCQQMVQMLTDGVILHRAFSMALADTFLGRALFQTFSDERGQGDEVALHTNLARRFFAALGLDHPDIDDPEFARWPVLCDSSFSHVTLMTAASLHPRLFLPEVLGLNLSLEVGALGGWMAVYRDQARHFGAPTTYFEIHNTIDNIDTGHSGLARDMIVAYLDDVLQRAGLDERDRHWSRIWSGLRAGHHAMETAAEEPFCGAASGPTAPD